MASKMTRNQIGKLVKQGDERMVSPIANAYDTLGDIVEFWGSMSTARSREMADRLRYLADLVDGRETSTGERTNYTFR